MSVIEYNAVLLDDCLYIRRCRVDEVRAEDREHIRAKTPKVVPADRLAGAVEALRVIAAGTGYSQKTAREALEAMGVDPSTPQGGQ